MKFNKSFLYSAILPIFIYAVIAFSIDQLTKKLVFIRFIFNDNPIIITPFLQIQMIYNYGVSFSFLSGLNINIILLISMLALIILLIFFYKVFDFKKTVVSLSIGLIIGATFGNMYDRWSLGAVIDFIYFHLGTYNFPIFNFSDVFISISAIILFINLYFVRKK